MHYPGEGQLNESNTGQSQRVKYSRRGGALRPPLGASPLRVTPMTAWTCYLCKSVGLGGSSAYQRHYLTHHAEDLNAEWVNR